MIDNHLKACLRLMLLSWRHVPSPLARIQLSHVTTYCFAPLRHYRNSLLRFFLFYSAFLLI